MSVFRWSIRVYHEDVDTMAIVYYANYLKYLERARTEWLRLLDIDQKELHRQYGIWFVVRNVTLDYKQSARLDDLLDVTVFISEQSKTSIEITQEIKRHDQCLLTAKVRLVCVTDQNTDGLPMPLKPVAIPHYLLDAWKEYHE